MRDFFTAYTNTNAVAFPDTEGVNASGPSETDGTEYVKISVDDGFGWGWMQALLSAAGLTPNGSAESVSNSQVLDSHEILFGIPDGYLSGLVPSSAADTAHDITFGVGEARSALASSLERILLATAITKQLDIDWAAGDNAGGFPSGLTLADATWYHLFLIKNNSTGVVDAGFDTSLTAANLLADATGYTEFRRVGSVLTFDSGGSNFDITPFTAVETAGGGAHFVLTTMVQEFSESPSDTTEQTKTLSHAPTGIPVWADLTVGAQDPSVTFINYGGGDEILPLPSGSVFDIKLGASSTNIDGRALLLTNTSAQMKYRVDDATITAVRVHNHGWIDSRR